MRERCGPDDWFDVMPLTTALGGGLNYGEWREEGDFLSRNAIFITTDPKPLKLAALRRAFASIEPARPLLELHRGGGKCERFWLIRCHSLLELPRVVSPARGV
jgi:hypothetical protein